MGFYVEFLAPVCHTALTLNLLQRNEEFSLLRILDGNLEYCLHFMSAARFHQKTQVSSVSRK